MNQWDKKEELLIDSWPSKYQMKHGRIDGLRMYCKHVKIGVHKYVHFDGTKRQNIVSHRSKPKKHDFGGVDKKNNLYNI
jgi:hypothetical protein